MKTQTLLKTTALPLALLLSTALAAPKISAQSIIVNPVQPDLKVSVWTDKDPSGAKTPNYAVGDRIRIFTSVNQDAYVYLFNVNPDGSIQQILPNQIQAAGNFVKANTVKAFPDNNDKFTFDIAGRNGVNKVLALASKTKLDLSQISAFESNQPFAQVTVTSQNGLAQALSIVVNPLPQTAWVTDTAQYQTVAGRAGFVNLPTNTFSTWRAKFRSDRNLKGVATFYENQLELQGYTVRTTTNAKNRIVTRLVGDDGTRAVLTVQQQPRNGEYNVVIERQDTE